MKENNGVKNLGNKYYKNFDEIYEKYKEKVRIYIYYKIGKVEDEEDLIHDIFMKVYECIDEYNENAGSFYCFILLKAKQIIYDYARKNKRRHEKFDEHIADFLSLESDNPYEVNESKEISNVVSKILSELPDNYREAILLVYRNEKTYKDAAKIMGKSEASFKSLLHRAKIEFRKKISSEYPDISYKYRHIVKVVLILCLSAGLVGGMVYATIKIYQNTFRKSTFTLSDVKEEIPEGNGIISREEAVNKINEYLSILGKEANVKSEQLKLVRDFQICKVCWTVTDDDNGFLMKIDAENGNLAIYNNYTLEKSNSISDVKDMYSDLKLPNNYELFKNEKINGIENRVFAKKYDKIFNKYESVTISLIDNKIQAIYVYDIPCEANSVLISKETAQRIFKENGINASDINLSIEMIKNNVKSNILDEEINIENRIGIELLKIDVKTRMVWKLDKDSSILIDACTGEIIGNEDKTIDNKRSS